MNPDKLLKAIFGAALRAVDPYDSVKTHAETVLAPVKSGEVERLVVLSFGKAAYLMTRALTDEAGDMISEGIVITKYGHIKGDGLPETITAREAGHPTPDRAGFEATKEAIRLAKSADERTLVACLISGGGSALLVAPYGDITLPDKQQVTRLLLRGGADIGEINTVRKHLSSVKGGRLAGLIYPGRVISLILSDVIGDRLDVIASGPTAPDNTTYGDALQVIGKYGLGDEMPPGVIDMLKKGAGGGLPETPKGGDPVFSKVENFIIGNNTIATAAAKTKAESLGLDATVIANDVVGEARVVAKTLAERAKKSLEALKRARAGSRTGLCLISGGEPTVTVTGDGLGGRNTELALAFALEIEGVEGITFLSGGTDGTDGPTDAAGAVVDGTTAAKARREGISPEAYLRNNDSYNFFKKAGGLVITGPTGTNVMDLQMAVIEPPPER